MIKRVLKEGIKQIFSDLHLTCEVCRREIFDGGYFCADCQSGLPLNDGAMCGHCGRHTKRDYAYCIECKDFENFPAELDRARSVFIYEDKIPSLIVGYKDFGKKYLAEIFAEFMQPLLYKYFIKTDALIFVPMYKKDEAKRGYNHSQLLAERLGALVDKPVLYGVLEKAKQTPAQKTLSRKQRLLNLQGVYRVKKRKIVEGKNILIVDDVLTTGATAHTVAEKLKKAGAASVSLITVASVSLR